MAGPDPAGLDVTTPNIARMYDYMLDGRDNFAADREAAEKLIAMMPQLPLIGRLTSGVLPGAACQNWVLPMVGVDMGNIWCTSLMC